MIELTKEQEQKLECLCSMCDHDCMDKNCLDNKVMEAKNPGQEMKRQILMLMNDVLRKNTTGNGRATIKTKKG